MKKILVVTSADVAARANYVRLLPHHALVFASDALQTLAGLAEHRDVDAILVDLSVLRRNAADVILRIDGNPVAHRLPLIVAGADDALLRSVKTARHGSITMYVSAPIRAEELARALAQATASAVTHRSGAA